MEKFDFKNCDRKDIERLAMLIGKHWAEIMTVKGQGIVSSASIEVEIKLNGVEISFNDFFKGIEEGYEKAVKEEAVRLVQEKCDGMYDAVCNLSRELEWKIRGLLDKKDG